MRTKLTILCLMMPVMAFAWGKKGHDTVACIAEHHLTEKTQEAVADLFEGKSLVYWAPWMDSASNQDFLRYTKTWHYINVDADQTYDTAPKNPAGDVVVAIKSQSGILLSKEATREEKQLALKILTHTVGDLNQPMHAGHASDRGGNNVKIKFFGRDTNLHSVWDGSIMDSAHDWSHSEWQWEIDRATEEKQLEITSGTIDDWARETLQIASLVYSYFEGVENISYDEVFYWTVPTEEYLLKGGLRLAHLLNWIFDADYRVSHSTPL